MSLNIKQPAGRTRMAKGVPLLLPILTLQVGQQVHGAEAISPRWMLQHVNEVCRGQQRQAQNSVVAACIPRNYLLHGEH